MTNRLKYPHLVEKAAELYLELRSTRKVAEELGIDCTTCWSYIRRAGVDTSAKNVRKIASKNKTIVIDGITFYWCPKGFYRGVTAPGRREMLSSYMYRKIHGTEKPKWLTIVFRDGNRDNYSPDNLDFVTASEWARIKTNEEDRHRQLCEQLDKGREEWAKMCERKPYLKTLTSQRTWRTRRRNDPEDTWIEKCQRKRRENAEKRGYWFSPEGIENMRKAHIGNTMEKVAMKRRQKERDAVMAKLGMRKSA